MPKPQAFVESDVAPPRPPAPGCEWRGRVLETIHEEKRGRFFGLRWFEVVSILALSVTLARGMHVWTLPDQVLTWMLPGLIAIMVCCWRLEFRNPRVYWSSFDWIEQAEDLQDQNNEPTPVQGHWEADGLRRGFALEGRRIVELQSDLGVICGYHVYADPSLSQQTLTQILQSYDLPSVAQGAKVSNRLQGSN